MLQVKYNKSLKPKAQELRRHATKQENHLWYDFLKDHPCQFRRQKQFDRYIVDFYCGSANLAIELDGAPHFTEEGILRDKSRDAHFKSIGLRVLHFTDSEVDHHFSDVCSRINQELGFTSTYP